jgi:hypothetical protein
MNKKLSEKRFEELAKIVGEILAKRWMRILAKPQARAAIPRRSTSADDKQSAGS